MRLAALALAAAIAVGCGGEADAGWRTIAPAPLSPRSGPAAVWTGERLMIIGGGNVDAWEGSHDKRSRAGSTYDARARVTIPLVAEVFADAAAYDPAMDLWERVPPLPTGGFGLGGSDAFWTGHEVLIWGGWDERYDRPSSGHAFDPGRETWREIARWPPVLGLASTAVWTGTELIVWGGHDHQPNRPAVGAAPWSGGRRP